jgi:hypothetical protein
MIVIFRNAGQREEAKEAVSKALTNLEDLGRICYALRWERAGLVCIVRRGLCIVF